MNLARHSHLESPVRNRWYTGKMLDAFHMELETDYGIDHRRLINRLVLGWGVVRGLDVKPVSKPNTIIVKPGLALDGWGREIVVPLQATPRAWTVPDHVIEEATRQQHPNFAAEREKKTCPVRVRVLLCYKETERNGHIEDADMDCGCDPASGMIHEGYEVRFSPRPAKKPKCDIPDIFEDGDILHEEVARWVTHQSLDAPKSPHVTLANLTIDVRQPGKPCQADQLDITVRRIVYSNKLLFQMILALQNSESENGDAE